MENNSKQHKISFKNSIKTKLITVMILVTAVPLLVAVLVSYFTSTKKALTDAQDSMEWQAWYIEDRFASLITQNMSIIKSLAVNPTIINFVTGEGGIPYDAVQLTLAGCDGVIDDGENTSVVNTEGMQIARGKGNFVSVADRDYFKAAISGQDFVSCINVSKTTHFATVIVISLTPFTTVTHTRFTLDYCTFVRYIRYRHRCAFRLTINFHHDVFR